MAVETKGMSKVVDPLHVAALAPHFDRAFYLAANPDIRETDIDPLEHFIRQGWKEGRNPSRLFDVKYYLAVNNDVAASQINPLLHFVWNGRREGRLPRRPLDTARQYVERAAPAHLRAADWAAGADRSVPLSRRDLAAKLDLTRGGRGVIISASHDDYAENYGGIQNLIGDEQSLFNARGWRYLHISPAAPLPMLAPVAAADGFAVKLRCDGVAVGVANILDVMAIVRTLAPAQRRELVVHHLMGFAPELLTDLAEAMETQPIFWVHDFFTLCTSYALMRNDAKFCGAPPVNSPACTVCVSGLDRQAHLPRIKDFFAAVCPTVLAPSAAALDTWLRGDEFSHAGATVVPLARCVMDDEPVAGPQRDAASILRVGFLGAKVYFKGWHVFEELALSFQESGVYKFYQLGVQSGPALPGCIENAPVRVTADNQHAMIEAIAAHRLDVVIQWSLWPETFCFAVHEAIAGGAFVVARMEAGNVWPAVQANAPLQGAAVETETELHDLFKSGEIFKLVAGARRARGALLRGGGTADVVAGACVDETPGVSHDARELVADV
jgi:hypothetical protein